MLPHYPRGRVVMGLSMGSAARPSTVGGFVIALIAVACTAAATSAPTTDSGGSGAPSVSDEGRILCASDPGAHGSLVTPQVQAHADGVHFVVVNQTDEDLIYDVRQVIGLT